MAAKKKPSAAQFRMAEEKSKKKTPRADSQGRTGMGATPKRATNKSSAEKLAWIASPELMALGVVLSKAETAARKKIFGSQYAGDPGEKKRKK